MSAMNERTSAPRPSPDDRTERAKTAASPPSATREREIGGPKGPEPTRYGDWERDGICRDF